jgi:hypothetical protein
MEGHGKEGMEARRRIGRVGGSSIFLSRSRKKKKKKKERKGRTRPVRRSLSRCGRSNVFSGEGGLTEAQPESEARSEAWVWASLGLHTLSTAFHTQRKKRRILFLFYVNKKQKKTHFTRGKIATPNGKKAIVDVVLSERCCF